MDCASILARFGVAPDRARFFTDAFATTVKAKNSSSFSGRQAAHSSCITHQFCYAAESRTDAPAASKRRLQFTYDDRCRRTEKLVFTNDGSGYVAQYTNRFLYDGWNLVAVLDGGNNLLQSYVWGTDLSGTPQGAGGVGGLLAITDYQGGTAGTYFPAYDGNGNVVALINAADGSTAAQYEYGPFGEVLRATGPMAKANSFRFSTKYQDDETDLLYYGVRYLNTSTGGWLSRDPNGEKAAFNLYGFVNETPLSKIDTDGREIGNICPNCGTYYVGECPSCGYPHPPPRKPPANNPCDGYKNFIPTPKCICNCKLIPDHYPSDAEKVCNGFMQKYNWSEKAQCVARCLVRAEWVTFWQPYCSTRALTRLSAHVSCYYECGFIPWEGLPPGGVAVGAGDLLWTLAKCRDPWNQAK